MDAVSISSTEYIMHDERYYSYDNIRHSTLTNNPLISIGLYLLNDRVWNQVYIRTVKLNQSKLANPQHVGTDNYFSNILCCEMFCVPEGEGYVLKLSTSFFPPIYSTDEYRHTLTIEKLIPKNEFSVNGLRALKDSTLSCTSTHGTVTWQGGDELGPVVNYVFTMTTNYEYDGEFHAYDEVFLRCQSYDYGHEQADPLLYLEIRSQYIVAAEDDDTYLVLDYHHVDGNVVGLVFAQINDVREWREWNEDDHHHDVDFEYYFRLIEAGDVIDVPDGVDVEELFGDVKNADHNQ